VPVIDTHAHVTPERFKEAIRKDGTWYGLGPEAGELDRPGFTKSMTERLEDMDATGIDRQLVTPTVGFYQYRNDLDVATSVARECNDEIAEIVDQHPDRFSGLATLPMQDVPSAVDELTRAVKELNLEGAIIGDHVLGRTYDEPEFLPFFRAAEALGAILFFHQGGDTMVSARSRRYSLPNGIGNLADRTLTFATLVFGGVMDACPNLKPLLAHGGGYTAFGIGRLDKVAGAFGRALRYLIDTVGLDRVMLGTDYPAPMLLRDAVRWVNGLDTLTGEEKRAILADNPTAFLGL
jgi:aminocarboxymuconate-semialdehyde decarboxylase